MAASLFLVPKPSTSKTLSLFFSMRSSTRRYLAASAADDDKEPKRSPTRSNVQQVSSKLKACNLFGVAAIANTAQSPSASAAPYESSSTKTMSIASQELYNFLHSLILADLDPATAKIAIGIAGPALSAFGFLFILRIVMSWYPKLPVEKFPYVLAYAPTEPFLSVTRKVIPPLGGVDVTPVVWFGLVSFLSEILVGPQGLLVLLSQQV